MKPGNTVWLLQRLGRNRSVEAAAARRLYMYRPDGRGCILQAFHVGQRASAQAGPTAGKRELWAHQALILGIHASNNCHFLELKAHPPLTLLGVRVERCPFTGTRSDKARPSRWKLKGEGTWILVALTRGAGMGRVEEGLLHWSSLGHPQTRCPLTQCDGALLHSPSFGEPPQTQVSRKPRLGPWTNSGQRGGGASSAAVARTPGWARATVLSWEVRLTSFRVGRREGLGVPQV